MTDLSTYWEQSYPPSIYGPPPTPVLSTLTPNSIVINTPTLVQVTGTGFRSDSKVWVDGVEQITTYQSPTRLSYMAQADTLGDQSVEVRTQGVASAAVTLTVTAT